jgi:plastocyanin
MNKQILSILLAALFCLPIAASHGKTMKKNIIPVQSPAPSSSAVTVHIAKDSMGKGAAAYGENPKVVKAGTQVTWINDDSVAHTVTSDNGAFDSGFIMPGKSWSYTFKQAGKFPYYCTLHNKQSMSGSIEVK